MVDHYMGNLLDNWGGEGNIFMISDHGFGPLHKYFYITNWLLENGFLVLKNKTIGKLIRIIFFRKSAFKFSGGVGFLCRFRGWIRRESIGWRQGCRWVRRFSRHRGVCWCLGRHRRRLRRAGGGEEKTNQRQD